MNDKYTKPKVFSEELKALLERAVVSQEGVFYTLGRLPAANVVDRVSDAALFVSTGRTAGGTGKPVPAWMFEYAWGVLREKGELSNSELIKEVKRSSLVMAVMATLPGVQKKEGASIVLRYSPPPVVPIPDDPAFDS